MNRPEVLQLMKIIRELFENCSVQVNSDNMDLYDKSPDNAVDYEALIKKIDLAIERYK